MKLTPEEKVKYFIKDVQELIKKYEIKIDQDSPDISLSTNNVDGLSFSVEGEIFSMSENRLFRKIGRGKWERIE